MNSVSSSKPQNNYSDWTKSKINQSINQSIDHVNDQPLCALGTIVLYKKYVFNKKNSYYDIGQFLKYILTLKWYWKNIKNQ